MSLPIEFQPTMAGVIFAAAAVVAGGPIFSDGLRVLRLRRIYRGLRRRPLAAPGEGVVHVCGRVALETPLFSPLTARPCAGFRLEIRSEDGAVAAWLDVFRPFRLVDGATQAVVDGEGARWELAVSGERRVAPAEPLTENLEALLRTMPEAVCLRRSGAAFHLVERALPAGDQCHVIGQATRVMGLAAPLEVEWLRTGTDSGAVPVGVLAAPEPALHIGPGDPPGHLRVSHHAPDPARPPVRLLRTIGLVLGPALALAGMLYLAAAAEFLYSGGWL